MAKKKVEENIVEETIKEQEGEQSQANKQVMEALGLRLKNKFYFWKKLRRPIEQEWIENLRQHKGIYDPEILSKLDKNSSKAYPKITRSKDNLVLSKLHEMLFPGTDRNWGVEPTPVPKVSKEVVVQLSMALVKQDPQTGTPILPTKDEIKRAIHDYSKMACEDMQREMDDQFVEMKYNVKVGKSVLRSGIILGTGIAKGVLVEKVNKREWEAKKNAIVAKDTSIDSPFFQFVPLWNWYPDMTVTEQEDMEGCFERHVYTKHQVRRLIHLAEFDTDTINQYLKECPAGDYLPEPWEQDVRGLSQEPASSGGVSRTESGDYIDMGAGTSSVDYGSKYEVLEYWGYIDGHDLVACGANLDEDEMEDEVSANIWLLGGLPIKVIVNPMPGRKDPYKLFYYEKDETSIFGEGLPRVIRHSQLSTAAATRMMLNNAAICSGPQFEINWDLVDTNVTDVTNIHPLGIWIRNGIGIESQYAALRIHQIDSHIPEYITIINQFQQFGDIESTLPTWMISEPMKSGNETAGAVSMKMGTINISLRDIVRNFDDFTENVVEALYLWNMEFNPKKEIKGDYKVKAKGSISLIMKEVRINALNMFATTMLPEDWAYVPRRQFLEERIKANDLDITIRTEEEAQAYIQSMIDKRAKELGYEDAEAEISKKQAMALKMATQSKKTTVESGEMMKGEEPNAGK